MAGIRLLERMLGRLSGVETAPIPEVLPREPSLPVPVAPQPMPEMKKRWRKYQHGLSHPLFQLSPHDPWTIGDSFEGTIITGDPGGGKTSGSGATIAKGMLRAGFGGLVTTHKSDEVTRWTQYAQETGRLQDLMIVAPGNRWKFNFLAYQFLRAGDGAGHTENTVNAFMNVLESRYRGGRRQTQEAYWTDGARRLLRHSLDALLLAGEPVTMDNILELIRSLPYPDRQTGTPQYRPDSYCQHCLQNAADPKLCAFFEQEFSAPGAERQNAGIISTLTNMADPFMSGPVRDLFCSANTSFVPEFSRVGVIIVLALPVLEWEDAGMTSHRHLSFRWSLRDILPFCFSPSPDAKGKKQKTHSFAPTAITCLPDSFLSCVPIASLRGNATPSARHTKPWPCPSFRPARDGIEEIRERNGRTLVLTPG